MNDGGTASLVHRGSKDPLTAKIAKVLSRVRKVQIPIGINTNAFALRTLRIFLPTEASAKVGFAHFAVKNTILTLLKDGFQTLRVARLINQE